MMTDTNCICYHKGLGFIPLLNPIQLDWKVEVKLFWMRGNYTKFTQTRQKTSEILLFLYTFSWLFGRLYADDLHSSVARSVHLMEGW